MCVFLFSDILFSCRLLSRISAFQASLSFDDRSRESVIYAWQNACTYTEKCGDIQAAAKLPQLRAREMEVVHRLYDCDFSFVNEKNYEEFFTLFSSALGIFPPSVN